MTHSTASRVLAILFVGAAISSSGVFAAPTPLPYTVYHGPPLDQSSNGQGSLPVGQNLPEQVPAQNEHTMDTANPANGGLTSTEVQSSHVRQRLPIRQRPEDAQFSNGGSTFNAGSRAPIQSSNEQGSLPGGQSHPRPQDVGTTVENGMPPNDGDSILPKDHDDTPLAQSSDKQKALLQKLRETHSEVTSKLNSHYHVLTGDEAKEILNHMEKTATEASKEVPADVKPGDGRLWNIKNKARVMLEHVEQHRKKIQLHE
ncbi:hypothetical protein EV361DRAFT_660042 [Lentinula raphanica]|uniref:Secreted protein n=1 Tax=Lentinula raphanica TaxID=153919 RepID=A0AA38PD84_9AGAR|nr:hypothetical protein F5878DRAFT_659113 [Lentinula raphanica]KAJ3977520.1 hypothetical protein EV361DRAFT_660042 [Lentinula raphanica]